ncbi:MAG: glycosyltransferase [Candidatus Hydrogenedentes bacterium]|nr:glycosyltransferase [Candidatus Hydrogenedentota bacterium]
MNVLCHGPAWHPFSPPDTFLELYRGPHDIRRLGIDPAARYRYDPLQHTAPEVIGRIAAEWAPDLLICWFPEDHPPPRRIEDAPVRTVAIPTDWNVNYPRAAVNLSRYDAVLCDRPGVAVLAGNGIAPQYRFPLYSHISTIHRPRPVDKDIDILYVGSWNYARNYRRAVFLERLAKLSGGYRVLITSSPPGTEYAELLCRARIVFNHSVRGELNLRVFETMACGALAFLEDSNQGVQGWFEDGRDIVLYNADNLEDRVHHYLSHPDEAWALAKRAQAHVAAFAGERRFDELIEWAGAQPPGVRTFRSLPAEERDYQDALLFGCQGRPEYHRLREVLLAGLTERCPKDPRVWTALGVYFTDPTNTMGTAHERQRRCVTALARAHQLDPASAPYAFNLATACRDAALPGPAADALRCAIEADSMAGAELVMGAHLDLFWQRWQQALTQRRPCLDALKAEAHVRLAHLEAQEGLLDSADARLARAAELDPDTPNRTRLQAEVWWAMGRKADAAALLQDGLGGYPFDFERRRRLCEMLSELGRRGESRILAEETLRIVNACDRGQDG